MSTTIDVLVLWLLPGSWLVHDLEEIGTIEQWSSRWRHAGRNDAPAIRRRLVETIASTRRRFTIAVALVGGVVVGATVAGAVDPTGIGLVVYATILGGYLLHGFVHLAQSFLLRGYAPGPATAIVLVIPVSLYLYWRLLAAGLIDIRVAAVTCLVGLVLFAPLIIGAGRLSVRVDRWLD